MTNRIDSQIDDMHALIKTMEREQRRKRMEREYGKIVTKHQYPPIPIRTLDWLAYFDRYLDVDWPSWSHADGPTEVEALDALLEQAEEHHAEQLDEKRLDELQRQSGCSDA